MSTIKNSFNPFYWWRAIDPFEKLGTMEGLGCQIKLKNRKLFRRQSQVEEQLQLPRYTDRSD